MQGDERGVASAEARAHLASGDRTRHSAMTGLHRFVPSGRGWT